MTIGTPQVLLVLNDSAGTDVTNDGTLGNATTSGDYAWNNGAGPYDGYWRSNSAQTTQGIIDMTGLAGLGTTLQSTYLAIGFNITGYDTRADAQGYLHGSTAGDAVSGQPTAVVFGTGDFSLQCSFQFNFGIDSHTFTGLTFGQDYTLIMQLDAANNAATQPKYLLTTSAGDIVNGSGGNWTASVMNDTPGWIGRASGFTDYYGIIGDIYYWALYRGPDVLTDQEMADINANPRILPGWPVSGPSVDTVTSSTPTDTTLPAGSTAQISGADGGTYWAGIWPQATPPTTHAQIVAGTGAVGAVQTGALTGNPANPVFAEFTGLNPDTAYALYVTAEDSSATPVSDGAAGFDNFRTLVPAVDFIVNLVDVETGSDWPDGSTINYEAWNDEDAFTGVAPIDSGSAATVGNLLTISAFTTAGQVGVFLLGQEEGTTAGWDDADFYGVAVETAVNTLQDSDGNVVSVEAPTGSNNYVPVQAYASIKAQGGVASILVNDDGTVGRTRIP